MINKEVTEKEANRHGWWLIVIGLLLAASGGGQKWLGADENFTWDLVVDATTVAALAFAMCGAYWWGCADTHREWRARFQAALDREGPRALQVVMDNREARFIPFTDEQRHEIMRRGQS